MVKTSLFFLSFFLSVVFSFAQQQTYLVQFKDKNSNSFIVDQPADFLSQKALKRRSKNTISINETDLPVTQVYIDQVVLAGAQLLYPLKWFNGVVVRSDLTVKSMIASLSFVASVNESVKFRVSNKLSVQSVVQCQSALVDFGSANVQNNMLGLDVMSSEGYSGKGVFIAVTDDGFLNVDTNPGFASLFLNNQIIDTYDIVDLDKSVYLQGGGHGAKVFSVIAGELQGQFLAPATGSVFSLFRTEDITSESPLEELNWVRAAEIADSAGVDIIQVSLGYNTFDNSSLNYTWADLDGNTSYISRGAKAAFSKGIIIVASAGNEGSAAWRKILFPADEPGVVSVGGVDFSETRAPFSSVGNTADGRLKPDVMAMGLGVTFIEPTGVLNSGSGTSFASPLITGLLAGLIEAHPGLTYKEIIRSLKKSADRYASPDSLYGYGIPNFKRASNYAHLLEDKTSCFVFPNPFSAELSVKLPAAYVGSKLVWQLYSINGKKIAEQEIVVDDVVVSLWSSAEGLSAGAYILKTFIGDDLYTFKIIK